MQKIEVEISEIKALMAERERLATLRERKAIEREQQAEKKREKWEQQAEKKREKWERQAEKKREKWEQQAEKNRTKWEQQAEKNRVKREKLAQEKQEKREKTAQEKQEKREKIAQEKREKWEKEYQKAREEREKIDAIKKAEWDEQQRLSKISMDELKASVKDLVNSVKELRIQTGGISESNGLFSETYFFNSLSGAMKFGDILYDEIADGVRRTRKTADGKKWRSEYDIVMYNGDSIALIEVKYKVRKGDVENLVSKQLENFKIFYPEYNKYKFYLGIAGMSFEHGSEEEAQKKGVGILRPKGESVEILDSHLITY